MPVITSTSPASFRDLGVSEDRLADLPAQGITTPFPIQVAALPDALAGRDVLGRGQTGSGKTLAFCVPAVTRLTESDRRRKPGAPRALVLVPTRELAAQVAATATPLASALGLKVATVIGGVSQGPQVNALRRGVDVLVATPGRLEDLIRQGRCRLDSVEITVLDEADHMADLGFLPAVTRILDQTPDSGQRMLFSATLDNDVKLLVDSYLTDPVTHSVDRDGEQVPEMEHHWFTVDARHKAQVVAELVSGEGRTLAFTRTKHGARKLAEQLTSSGIPALDLHGNLTQAARQRNLSAFAAGHVRVLVATDIAARGIHVDQISLVVHVDPPAEHKAYLHRSGRTARAGSRGSVVTVGTTAQRRGVHSLMKRARVNARSRNVAPGDPVIGQLSGPAAPPGRLPRLPETRPATGRRPSRAGARSGRRRTAHR